MDDAGAIERQLERARVLIVGVGGLGTPAAMQLAAAGIGRLGLMDADLVEISNLQRQILYRVADLARPKVVVAAERVAACHPRTRVHALPERLTVANLPQLFPQFDFIIDGTDHVETKFLINDGAIAYGVPYSHAGVVGFHGQTFTVLPQRSACLRCVFPTPPQQDDLPTCQTAGVLGALVGVIGLIQAAEAVKYLLGVGDLLSNRMLTGDAWRQRWRHVPIAPNRRCPVCRAAVPA